MLGAVVVQTEQLVVVLQEEQIAGQVEQFFVPLV
jgi:hypothetical protein